MGNDVVSPEFNDGSLPSWNWVLDTAEQRFSEGSIVVSFTSETMDTNTKRIHDTLFKLYSTSLAAEEEDDDDEWDDASHCDWTKKNGEIVLQIAGGGSHAWCYVLKWKGNSKEPDVYIWKMPFSTEGKCLQSGKTLLLRTGKIDGTHYVKMVDKGSEFLKI